MPPKRSSKASKQSAIAFYPTLNKPATAVGKYISAPGKFWNGCPAADKEKRFKCAVVEFSALHDGRHMHHTMGQPVSTGLPQPGAQAGH